MEIRRKGAPKATLKQGTTAVVRWDLTGQTDKTWRDLFNEPEEYDTSHLPVHIDFVGATAGVTCPETKIGSYLEWFDRWAQSANERYAKIIAERERQQRARQEEQDREREELRALNERLRQQFGE